MEFRSNMLPEYLKEQIHYLTFSDPRTFGRAQNTARIILIVLFFAIPVLWLLFINLLLAGLPLFQGTVLFGSERIISCLIFGFMWGYAFFSLCPYFLLHAAWKKAIREFIPRPATCRLTESGLSLIQEDGYSVFVPWQDFSKVVEAPGQYLFFSYAINFAFLKQDLAGQEEKFEQFIQTHFGNKSKPVLREKSGK